MFREDKNRIEMEGRGRVFQEYDAGCFRNRGEQQKGKDAERVRSLTPQVLGAA